MNTILSSTTSPVRPTLVPSPKAARPFIAAGSRTSSKPSRRAEVNASSAEAIDGGVAGLVIHDVEQKYQRARDNAVNQHFPNSLLIEDFVHRAEIALYQRGFCGDNTIACLNLCRDEITGPLKNQIDLVFGHSFNINGLGGVLTAGVIGMGAGLSHSPVDVDDGKERYVFFSFPHIAVSPYNEPGVLCRPGRPGQSSACGAVKAALGQFQSEGVGQIPEAGQHDPENPEYSILKARLQRRIKQDNVDTKSLDLVGLTKIAERVITSDLEFLISKAVDTSKADYAVITGVQIHSWGKEYGDGTPNLEYAAPTTAYTVVGGQKSDLNLTSLPALTPRQSRELQTARNQLVSGGNGEGIQAQIGGVRAPDDSSSLKEKAAHFQNLLSALEGSGGSASASSGKKGFF